MWRRIRTADQKRPARAPEAPADAFVWEAEDRDLLPVAKVAALPLDLLKGIDFARDTLLENTRRFAAGLPANNALLWGARGTRQKLARRKSRSHAAW